MVQLFQNSHLLIVVSIAYDPAVYLTDQEYKEKYNINTHSIITIQDILEFIETRSDFQKYQSSVREYIEKYGV